MIRIAIVEDNVKEQEITISFINKFCKQKEVEVSVSTFCDGVQFLNNYAPFDIVLMDVELPNMDGMTCAHNLRNIDKNVMIVFITNLAQYAVSGYEVGAFDFLVKPVSYYNFVLKFTRIFAHLEMRRPVEIWVNSRTGKTLVKAEQITYVEVRNHTLTFHTLTGEVNGSGSLKSIMDTLSGLSFALCNQCYLVNLKYVMEIDGDKVVVNGETLKISAPKRKEFLLALNTYLGSGGGV